VVLALAALALAVAAGARAQEPPNVDSDGDGLLDSEEDLNGNGKLDHGKPIPTSPTPTAMGPMMDGSGKSAPTRRTTA
jgi:hypothetical protein